MSNLPQMTYPQITETLQTLVWTVPNPSPLVLLGPPGVAKTQFCRSLPATFAKARGIDPNEVGYLEFPTSERDAADVAGMALPAKAEGQWLTSYSRSPLLCLIEDAMQQQNVRFLILNIDEITQCNQDMAKAIRGLLDADTRRIGNDTLPEGVVVVATGNRLADKAGSQRMMSQVANAVFRCEVTFDAESWASWAEREGLHPLLISVATALTPTGFFVESVPAEDTQFCTPRSFARIAKSLTAVANASRDPNVIPNTLVTRKATAAAIGEAAAEQMFTYLECLGSVPTASEIQADPETATLSDETHFQHAAAQVALSSATDSVSGERALQYIIRLRADLQISTVAMMLRRSVRNGWTVTGPVAGAFLQRHAELLPLTEGYTA